MDSLIRETTLLWPFLLPSALLHPLATHPLFKNNPAVTFSFYEARTRAKCSGQKPIVLKVFVLAAKPRPFVQKSSPFLHSSPFLVSPPSSSATNSMNNSLRKCLRTVEAPLSFQSSEHPLQPLFLPHPLNPSSS